MNNKIPVLAEVNHKIDTLAKMNNEINALAKHLPEVRLMEVCGGHTNTIMTYGIRGMLPKNIKLVSGPGCPVCVTSQKDIDSVIELAMQGEKITTYWDMLKVPGTKMSLEQARENGADIKAISTAGQALKYPDSIFFAIGFETTTPMTAYLLKKNITIYPTHKTMMPAMRALVQGELKIDGFIDPGHVSTITGSRIWEELDVPQVISGFKPEQVLRAIHLLLDMIYKKETRVINDYDEAVRKEGNQKAKAMIKETMKQTDSEWRGLGVIKGSGLEPREDRLNAKVKYKDLLETVISTETPGCMCGQVLKGMIEPEDCPLFSKICTPQDPKGACMVSRTEGACAIAYRYK